MAKLYLLSLMKVGKYVILEKSILWALVATVLEISLFIETGKGETVDARVTTLQTH